MSREKTVQVSAEAIALKGFIARLLKGTVEQSESVPDGMGSWEPIAITLLEKYQTGLALNGVQSALEFTRGALHRMCLLDSALHYLVYTVSDTVDDDIDLEELLDDMPPLPERAAWDYTRGKEVREWLDAYMEWSGTWASRGHPLFHEAIGLWILSALAARRIYLPMETGKYTPLYVLLAAETSRFTKSTTARLAKVLLEHIGLDWLLLPGKMTPEVFYRKGAGQIPEKFQELPEAEQERVLNQLSFAGQRPWYYDEFGGQLSAISQTGSPMRRFMEIFLEADDCPSSMSNETILRGNEHIDKPYLPMLGCMTIENVQSLPSSYNLWLNGLFARTVILTPPDKDASKAPMMRGEVTFPDYITEPLLAFHKQLGNPDVTLEEEMNAKGIPNGVYKHKRVFFPKKECTIDDDVFDAFNTYSESLLDIVLQKNLVPKELHGNYMRFPEKAMRVAALLAWLNNGGNIAIEHWIAAQDIAERWRKSLHEFYNQSTEMKTSFGKKIEEKILKFIKANATNGGLRAYQVAGRLSGVKSKDIAEYLESMVAIGTLVRYEVPGGKTGAQYVKVYTIPGGKKPENAIENRQEGQGKG